MNAPSRISALLLLALAGCAAQAPMPMADTPMPVAPTPTAGAIAAPDSGLRLFGDLRAREVGDILTVILTERTSASKSASTSTSKEASLAFGVPTLLGQVVPEGAVGVDSDRDFSGSGSSNQSNQLTGSLSVTVVERLANGNLRVRGQKQLRLNQGKEFVRLEGLVRAHDISPSNTVASTQIADARIEYSGRGRLADANAQGWLSRFFNSKWWPF